MKIKISQLRKIIREEVQRSLLSEGPTMEKDSDSPDSVLITVKTANGNHGVSFKHKDLLAALQGKKQSYVDAAHEEATIEFKPPTEKGAAMTANIAVFDENGGRIGGDEIDVEQLTKLLSNF